MVDIGGGSLELAQGLDEDPDVAVSLPLGAGRVTRDLLAGDPPSSATVREARRRVRALLAKEMRPFTKATNPDRAVGTSKTMRSLARICGAAPSSEGMYAARHLDRAVLSAMLPKLAAMTTAERQQLSGTPLHFGFRTPSDQARDTDILESRKFGQQVVELENESDLLVTEPRQSPITER